MMYFYCIGCPTVSGHYWLRRSGHPDAVCYVNLSDQTVAFIDQGGNSIFYLSELKGGTWYPIQEIPV